MKVKAIKVGEYNLSLPLGGVESGATAPAPRASVASRIRRFVEESDWEEKFFRVERAIDAVCWAAIGAAVFLAVPLCLRMLSG